MKVVILAGGGGTRLFPLSRSCYPKQFLEIAGQPSLLAQTLSRYRRAARDSDIIIITNDNYIDHVKAELRRLAATDIHILTEPVGRNTAPAIALALSYAMRELGAGPDEPMVVTPSDHRIEPEDAYIARIHDAAEIAAGGSIVTLGVVPERAETGYGYIEATGVRVGNGYRVRAFTEKPDATTAARYLAAGNYYWNSGVFIFTIGTMIQEMQHLAPAIAALASGGYEAALAQFHDMPNISIDYAIAEKSDRMAVVPMDGIFWSDIGSFDAIFDLLQDHHGNAIYGDVKSKECHNTMLLGGKRLIVGLGLEDIMVIDTPDVLLVARRGESQKVKDIVSELKSEHRREVEESCTIHHPQGREE